MEPEKKSGMSRLTEHCIFRNGILHNGKNLNVHSNDRFLKKNKQKTRQNIKLTKTHTNLSIYEALDCLPDKFTRFAKGNILF